MQIQSALKEIEICSKLIFIVARKKYRSEYISADDMMSVRENLKQMTELFKNLPPEQITEGNLPRS